MDEFVKFLSYYGFSKQSINRILINTATQGRQKEVLFNNFKGSIKYFEDYGCQKPQIIKILTNNPGLSYSKVDDRINCLKNLKFVKLEIIKIISNSTVLTNSEETIQKKFHNIESLGYCDTDVIHILVNTPTIYDLNIEQIKDKIDDIVKLGYTKIQVLEMIRIHPAILTYNISNIKDKIEDIIKLGYTKEEVLKMIFDLPTLLGLSIDNIKRKIIYLQNIGLKNVAVVHSKYLMQSVELTYARYEFLTKENNEIITMDNYNKLFYRNKQFSAQYKVDKEELLEKYPYQDQIERKNEI